MFGSNVIDTAIGLAFVFLLVSLACTALKEGMEVWWQKRATYLREGLARLMGEVVEKGKDAPWLTKLYDEPLIQSLCRDWKQWPAYIPAGLFARSLISLVRKGSDEALKTALDEALRKQAAAPAAEKDAADQAVAAARAAVRAAADRAAAVQATAAQAAAGQAKPAEAALLQVTDFLALVDAFPNARVRESLRAAVRDGAKTIEQVQADIEDWFNGSMDRVSGWYKRWSQHVVLAIGAVLVCALNVDTLAITRVLWTDPSVRAAVVEDARAALDRKQAADQKAADAAKKAGEAPKPADAGDDPLKAAKDTRATLASLGVPVGWDPSDPISVPTGLVGWGYKLLGLAVSILAVTLGAPFWFDVLNKFMIVRSTVKPREKSPDEPPVDGPPPPRR